MTVRNLLRISTDPILRKIIFLVVLVVATAGILVGESHLGQLWLSRCRERYDNQHARRSLGRSMRIGLVQMESVVEQLAAEDDLRSIALLRGEILTLIGSVEDALTVLSNGGVYEHVVRLNLKDTDAFHETISYSTTKHNRMVIEVIELAPRLADLEANVTRLADEVERRIAAKDHQSRVALGDAVTLRRKQAEATLLRAGENANKIYYDTSRQLIVIGRENEQIVARIRLAENATAGVLILVCLIVGGVTVRDVVRILNERRNALSDLQKHHDHLDQLVDERTVALEQVSRRHELILDSAGEGILGVDAHGKTTFVNPAAANMFGREVGELVGTFHHGLVHHTKADGTPNPEDECPIRATLKEGTPHRITEDVFWRKDGTSFPVIYSSTPIREKGELTGAVVTFQDMTERKHLEAKLLQAQKLESIGQLAAGIAHEINTPTQYIGDNTRFLRDSIEDLIKIADRYGDLLDADREPRSWDERVAEIKAALEELDIEFLKEEIPKAIDQSLEGVERVATIVRSMKEFSHPGGKDKQPADLNKAIESTVTVARNEWKYVAEMVTDFDASLPLVPCLLGDFNQVILNMLINAAHAIRDVVGENTGEKGTITLMTRRDGDWAEIRIGDTGTGMPPEVRAKVFDPFFTTKELGKGTGQGLAIAHAVVVKKHGGRIDVASEVGQGTTFIIRLPIELEPAEEPAIECHEEAHSIR
ncbi:MAG: ATP-binding protein [Phycisphaerae bacterium]